MRVLIVGLNFAPELSGIAPYTTGLAAGLRDMGHEVRVITTFPHYPAWTFGSGTAWSRSENQNGVMLRRVRHLLLTNRSHVLRAVSELSFGIRALTSSWKQPDVVVAVSPALLSSSLVLARCIYGRRRPAFGLVVQDLYSAGIKEARGGAGAASRALSVIESWSAQRADGLVAIHPRFASSLRDRFSVGDNQVRVIRNWTHVSVPACADAASMREALGWTDRIVVLHSGAMGDKQDLGNVVEAARIADHLGSRLRFVLMGDGSQKRTLMNQAEGIRAIQFVDPMPQMQFVQALQAADVLLVNERPGVKEMAVPSKLTSYFSAGRPVLAATEAGSTTAEEIAASGAGVRVDPGDPGALLRAAEELGRDKSTADMLGARGPRYCSEVLSEAAAVKLYETWIHEIATSGAIRRGEK